MVNNYYIYIYLDPRKSGRYCYNNLCFLYEPFYVGKGRNKRWKEIGSRSNNFIETVNIIEKIGLKPIVIKLYENLNEEKSFELETKLINEIGRINLVTGFLINKTSGGQGISGMTVSEETKNKISKKHKGKILSKEHKNKISESHKGKMASEETRIKMGKSRKGKHRSEESIKKMSESKIGENNPSNKLTKKQVIQIKLLLKEGILTQQEIADMFGVSRTIISAIKTGRCWSHIRI